MCIRDRPCDLAWPFSGSTKQEDLLHYISCLWIPHDFFRVAVSLAVTVPWPCGESFTPLGLSLLYSPNFPAGILGVEFVEQIFERYKIVFSVEAVYVVVDGDKPYTVAGEHQLSQFPDFQIFTSKPGQILDDQGPHHTALNEAHR